MNEEDYILSIIEQMSDAEVIAFNNRFDIVDVGGELKNKIINHEYDVEKLREMYTWTRDGYWGE